MYSNLNSVGTLLLSEFFEFYNVTSHIRSTVVIPEYGINSVPDLYFLDDDQILQLFRSVLQLNAWNDNDIVEARPDRNEYCVITYNKGNLDYEVRYVGSN